MRKKSKLTYLIYLVLMLVLAGNASAWTAYEWTGEGPNTLWDEKLNWDPNTGVPGGDPWDTARLNITDANCLIDSNVTVACFKVELGDSNGPCYLNMTGGTLVTSDKITVADDTNGIGRFTMSGGTVTSNKRVLIGDGGDLTAGDANRARGTFVMTGGVFTIPEGSDMKLELGKNETGIGWMYMHGGTVFVGDDFEIGKYGRGTLVMTGGDVNIVENLKLGRESDEFGTGYSHIDLFGGNIYCEGMWIRDSDTTIDIEKGELEITPGTKAAFKAVLERVLHYGSEEWITGYGGDGDVVIDAPDPDFWVPGDSINITAKLDPNLAWKPIPKNYAVVQWTPAGPTLEWQPAQTGEADKHDVYFGTVYNEVNDANRDDDPCNNLVSKDQDPCTIDFNTPPPVLGQTYYWRIDEVNVANPNVIYPGNVWWFTIADYLDVENFEYNPTLTEVWGLTGPTGTSISLEDTTVRSGDKSMKYVYDTNVGGSPPFYTEAYADTTGPNSLDVATQDWAAADVNVKALTLYFYGTGGNDAEQMYVALRDTDGNLATVYYGNPDDLNEPKWHEWNIKLSDFNDINVVNLSDVNKVYIGFGNRQSPAAGGSGTVYFDDIRLYPRRCVPVHGPAGDISFPFFAYDTDCFVDLYDFGVMAKVWRETDPTRVGSDAELKGGAAWKTSDCHDGNCIELDGIDDWVDLDDSDFRNFHNKTIAFWVKVMDYPTPYRYMFYFTDEDNINPYRINFVTRDPNLVRARFIKDYFENFTADVIWSHMAFVLEDTAEGCTGTFYGDGMASYGIRSGRPKHFGDVNGVNLGSSNDGSSAFVNARFDDFRVYDRALTGDEVYNLYDQGTEPDANMLLHYDFDEGTGTTAQNSSNYEFYHPLVTEAELYDDEAVGSREINFRDLAILVEDWLKEEKLWPPLP